MEEGEILEKFEFKIFYSIYQDALLDKELTSSVKKLFSPILLLRGPFPNNPRKKDENLHFEIDSKKASEWTGNRRVRKDIAMAAQNDADLLEDIIYNIENEIIPNDMIPEKVDDTLERLYERAKGCNISDEVHSTIEILHSNHKVPELYAQLFIWSLYVDGNRRKSKAIPEPSTEALDEFEQAIRRKYKKTKSQSS